jgi:hypothetical protein
LRGQTRGQDLRPGARDPDLVGRVGGVGDDGVGLGVAAAAGGGGGGVDGGGLEVGGGEVVDGDRVGAAQGVEPERLDPVQGPW